MPTAKPPVKKISYKHEAMAEAIVADPAISQTDLAEKFSCSRAWVAQVLHSDEFQAYLAALKNRVIDPVLVMTVEARLKGLVAAATEVLHGGLGEGCTDYDLAAKVLDISTRGLAQLKREAGDVSSVRFVVEVPGRLDSGEWLRRVRGEVVDVDVEPDGVSAEASDASA